MLPFDVKNDVTESYDAELKSFRKFWQVTIKLNDSCSLRCKHCVQYVENKDASHLPINSLLKLIDTLRENDLARSILLTGGEPLIYEEFDRTVRVLNQTGIPFDVNTGLFVPKSKVELLIEANPRTIRYSLHSDVEPIQNDFSQRSSWKQIVANGQLISSISDRKYRIQINISVSRNNYSFLPRIIGWFIDYLKPDDINLCAIQGNKYLQLNEGEISHYYKEILPEILVIANTQNFDQLPVRASNLFGYDHGENFISGRGGYIKHTVPCYAGQSSIYIDNFGDVYPCIAHHAHRFSSGSVRIGNILSDTNLITMSRNPPPCYHAHENETCKSYCPLFLSNLNLFVAHLEKDGIISNNLK